MMTDAIEKLRYRKTFGIGLRIILGCASVYLCLLVAILAIPYTDDLKGVIAEMSSRYPGSTLVHEDYVVYGISDDGIHLYIRWTPDNIAVVEAHYTQSPRSSVRLYEMATFRPSQLSECEGDFDVGVCQAFLSQFPDTGTLIVTSHTYRMF